MDNLISSAVVSRPSVAVAAGQTEIDGNSVDMAGLDEVTFLALFNTIVAGGTPLLKVQQSSDNGNTDPWADIANSSQSLATGNSGQVAAITVYRPVKRYVRPVVQRGGGQNATLDGIVALARMAKKLPVTQSADVAVSTVIQPTA